jgi:tetratricopeptide (TPR) repeat protein
MTTREEHLEFCRRCLNRKFDPNSYIITYLKRQMKSLIVTVIFFMIVCGALAQNKEEAEKLVDDGIVLHDRGDYEAAIKKYDNALAIDKNNLLAMAEKGISLMALQKYDAVIDISQLTIDKHANDEGLKSVYVTYGNALDALNKPDRALEIYDEGIIHFPYYYQLHFNRGVTLAGLQRYDEGILSFQQSVMLNPKHASSHNAIGRLLNMKGQRVPAILAFTRFLILESESQRAKENIEILRKLIKGNVEQTSKNGITINLNPNLLSDTTADGKSKENSFSTVDLILTMHAALDYDKKNKNKTEVEKFIGTFETLCSGLEETERKNFGFYWDYYVPYFIEMKNKNQIETMAYIVFNSSQSSDVSKWLKSHNSELDKFYEWSKTFSWKEH